MALAGRRRAGAELTAAPVPSGPPLSTWTPSARELERRALRASQRRRSISVSTLAVVVVFGVVGGIIVNTPGWPAVRESFFNWDDAKASFPEIWSRVWLNVVLFIVCEIAVLMLALLVALARTARASVLVPLRIVATVYTDVFRGIPTIVLLFLLAFGMPALQLAGLPNNPTFWAGVALVLSYGAYVAEVFRSGIQSVHPSQISSAEALGLSRAQTLRLVVIPQAIRRIVPPLLNDFVSLQKDTALVAAVSVFDMNFAAQDYSNYNFNFTSYVVVAVLFIVVTIPLARLTDWLQERLRRRELAGRV